MLTGISAITLATHDMARAVAFYEALRFVLKFGGPAARFTSFRVGSGYLNLMSMPREDVWGQWGRAIFYVDDVDAYYAQAVSAGLRPEFSPRDGSWGERYFHILDPDGHELSFARPI
jgi:catechol 2,3-dioxygenase-like lactoylglutathione lyase family enzyme